MDGLFLGFGDFEQIAKTADPYNNAHNDPHNNEHNIPSRERTQNP